jgi:tetratricopeptide (TPR) repeat protein
MQKAADLDRERKAGGQILLRYASTAEEKMYDDVALDGYDRILKLQPSERVRGEALYRKASVLLRLGRRDESLAAYDAAASGNGPFAFKARLEKAGILDREMHRPEEALAAYEQVLNQLGTAPGGDEAQMSDDVRLAMAECQLRLARPDEAMRLYQELTEKGNDPETRAASLYQVGEMLFYQGKLKEAEDTWYQLTDKYPTLRWVNDALARILLLGENGDAGGVPVTALAQAEYQRRLGNVNAGLKLVDEALAQYPTSGAADDLLLERVSLLLTLGKVPEAKTVADTLAARFPKSLLAPRALMAVANEQARQPGGGTEAQALYMELLLRFPDSLEAADARAVLQRLKDKNRDSSTRGTAPPRAEEGRG